jgi:excisionase family DNA binding protein
MSAYLLTDEAAAEIRETPQTVAEKCLNGEIKATRLGRGWRIKRADLDAYMESRVPARPGRRSTLERGVA